MMEDKIFDECGVFGIYDHKDAAFLTLMGLFSLQHRGQEGCGIVSYDGQDIHIHKGMGLVSKNFSLDINEIKTLLPGNTAIGHVRYATTGQSNYENLQPLCLTTAWGHMAIAHNGNLTNTDKLRQDLLDQGHTFLTTTDTEVILKLVALSQKTSIKEKIIDGLQHIEGAYSLIFLTSEGLYAVRDPYGIRPLSIGTFEERYVLSSETCTFDLIGAEIVRDVHPGELICINTQGITSSYLQQKANEHFCSFEYIYFMRPNSQMHGKSIALAREAMGKRLALESPVAADIVIPVPDSGIHAAIGFAEATGIPFKQGILRSHFTGRTFIQPTQTSRDFLSRLKLSINKALVKDKRVVLIDDSIVRGTTMPKIVKMLIEAGAVEVHVRISSPPFRFPCFYGIDTPCKKELTAAQLTLAEMTEMIGCDSLAFISLAGIHDILRENNQAVGFCDACFSGNYPVKINDERLT